jgi:hypothetical protein
MPTREGTYSLSDRGIAVSGKTLSLGYFSLGQQRKVTRPALDGRKLWLLLLTRDRESVKSPWIPAFAGMTSRATARWIPAFAGMTGRNAEGQDGRHDMRVFFVGAVAVEQPAIFQAPEGGAQDVRC